MVKRVSTRTAGPLRRVCSIFPAISSGLTKSVALDFVSHQIRCNCVCPGTVDVRLFEHARCSSLCVAELELVMRSLRDAIQLRCALSQTPSLADRIKQKAAEEDGTEEAARRAFIQRQPMGRSR
jgi:NAD(P)-dependent dehydrogenase (short-subunit alcohol dehydrogenase family)